MNIAARGIVEGQPTGVVVTSDMAGFSAFREPACAALVFQRDIPEHIFAVPTGAPILLHGSHWPPKPECKLLHRSPPNEDTGETRLVLVLDPISNPDKTP